MKIKKSTTEYEAWLGKQLTILPADLEIKHQQMRAAIFPFLRATYYRWAELFPATCPNENKAPVILAVGDLHVENFGTWRDIEGRLVWGVNDFDEAYPLPYTNDLVRLATSAHVAIHEGNLKIDRADACNALLEGYETTLAAGGRPFVLAEEHNALREMVQSRLRAPEVYWKKLNNLPTLEGEISPKVRGILEKSLPAQNLNYRIAHRVAGLGSLGRERYAAIAGWKGGLIAREAKALAPSAASWAAGKNGETTIYYSKILAQAVRCPDPLVQVEGRWIVRRLSPDCSRIELSDLSDESDEIRLLRAMGAETANIHLGNQESQAIKTDLAGRHADWLHNAARAMLQATSEAWGNWRTE